MKRNPHPRPDALDDAVRSHYAEQAPDAATLRRLRRAVRAAAPAPGPGTRRRPSRMAVAAVSLALLVPVTLLWGLLFVPRPDAGLVRLVTEEIALNHRKRLRVEWPAGRVEELAGQMPKLDFAPRWPAALNDSGWELSGGRYCSVGGRIAAQLRLHAEGSGDEATLYAFRAAEPFAELADGERSVDGTRVRLWREGGLIFGLATERGVEAGDGVVD